MNELIDTYMNASQPFYVIFWCGSMIFVLMFVATWNRANLANF